MSPRYTPGETEYEESEVLETPRESMPVGNKLAFAALLFIVTCINSTFSLMAPIFPQEAERRGIPPLVTGAVFSIYSFTNFFVSPLHGRIMQRRVIERRSMLLLGLSLSSLASLGFALSVYIPDRHRFPFSLLCLALRVVNGVGAAAVDTSSMAMVTQLFRSSEYFGTLLGVLESCLAVGWMVGPLFGGYLAVWGGFSAPFYAAAAIGFLMIPVPFLMPDNQKGVLPAHHSTAHITHWSLLGHLEISLLMLVSVLSAAAITFCDSVLAPFLQDKEHFSAGTVGACFAVIAASYATATTAAGWLSDKSSPNAVIVTGLLLCVLPFALLGPSPLFRPALEAAGLLGGWLIWLSLILLGAGCAFGLMPVLPAVLAVADRESLGHAGIEDLASGMIGGAYYLGGGAGPILGGAATALVGFEWASTSYGIGLLLLSTALITTLLITKRRRRVADELQEALLPEP